MIVANALDDLEAEHVDLATALTLAALAAWHECEQACSRALCRSEPPSSGGLSLTG